MSESEKDLRINVDKSFLERLEKIKAFYGVKSNAEMVRVIVAEKYHDIIEKEKEKKKLT